MSELQPPPAGPASFATLVRIAGTYCHPEAGEEAYEDLRRLARREGDEDMVRFKHELRDALAELPGPVRVALYDRVQYDDGSAVKFLRRLWRDLYPDEPVPAA
jgi:hypothetical protein